MFLLLTLLHLASAEPVTQAFPPPSGTERVPADAFGLYLQQLDLRPDGTPVRTYDGQTVRVDARVIDLPLVRGNLQQCADTALRLRATWLRSEGKPVQFHATSGDLLPFSKMQAGQTPYESKGRIAWKAGNKATFDSYLRHLFMWAGTASLNAYDTLPDAIPNPGDLLVDPGFPGHAMIIVDVATDGEATYLLLAQGFMPAQDAHIPRGPHQGWWRWSDGVRLPWWRFDSDNLRRWKP